MTKQILENIRQDAFDKMSKRAEKFLRPTDEQVTEAIHDLSKMLKGIK